MMNMNLFRRVAEDTILASNDGKTLGGVFFYLEIKVESSLEFRALSSSNCVLFINSDKQITVGW